MNKYRTACQTLLSASLISLLGAPAADAHHSFSMFNRDVQMVITGTVSNWAFNNPHSWLYIDVPGDNGESVVWGFEGAAPPQLIGKGITGKTFQPGTTVTVLYCPLVDGRAGGAMGWVKQLDDTFVFPNDGGCRSSEEEAKKWLENSVAGAE